MLEVTGCERNLAGAENLCYWSTKFHACKLCGFCIKLNLNCTKLTLEYTRFNPSYKKAGSFCSHRIISEKDGVSTFIKCLRQNKTEVVKA
jgi:hypothetical protein